MKDTMNKILELLADDTGRLSNMRLNCTVLILSGCFIVIYATMNWKLDANVIAAAALLITIGITGKAVQKGQELNNQVGSGTPSQQ